MFRVREYMHVIKSSKNSSIFVMEDLNTRGGGGQGPRAVLEEMIKFATVFLYLCV